MRKLNLCIKRLIDIIGSLFGIIILLPLFFLIAICIKLTSKGPVFFLQDRIGKNGKIFKIVKFRTMIVNAELIGDKLKISSDSDNRITSIGRILRKLSLDELPQLFCVFIGTMSLVGPRPPATYHPYNGYDNYPEWAKMRFSMQPGMTGFVQTTVRNSVSWDERIEIDNKYVNDFNVIFDIKLLFMTFIRIFKSNDIYADHDKNKTLIETEEKEVVKK